MLIHGDSVYDIIDKQDHQAVQTELCRSTSSASPGSSASPKESRMFLCRINVARNARRQMRFGDQKVSYRKFIITQVFAQIYRWEMHSNRWNCFSIVLLNRHAIVGDLFLNTILGCHIAVETMIAHKPIIYEWAFSAIPCTG